MTTKSEQLFQKQDRIKPTQNDKLQADIQARLNSLTKPPDSLGRLEQLAIKMGLIQRSVIPEVDKKIHLIFASDHGINEEGVSAYPSEVTRQMVLNMLGGGAAISVFCKMSQTPCKVYDIGVIGELPDHPDLLQKKVREGTANFMQTAAMTPEEMYSAMEAGYNAVAEDFPDYQLYSLGEMGIANTTPSAAVICATEKFSVEAVCGKGTGLNDQQLSNKVEVIRSAIKKHSPDSTSPYEILRTVGGLEIAALVGAILAGAERNKVMVLDGVITGAAFVLAEMMQPAVGDYCIFGHRSADRLGNGIVEHTGEIPLLDLGMRLGEGTGAVLSTHLLQAACNMMSQMATFQSANVSGKS